MTTDDPFPRPSIMPHPPLVQYYGRAEQRRRFVSTLFDETATEYDWIIRAMSFGSGGWYRRQALRRAGLRPDAHVLDVATGTGVVARGEAAIVGPQGSVLVLDRSHNMLREARQRIGLPGAQASAESLPFADASFDFLSMGYALRHVDDLIATFAEYRRVLRPGGTALILELTRPVSPVAFAVVKAYLRSVVPWMARIGSGREEAAVLMRYFWDTIENCVPPESILGALSASGLIECRRHRVFGIFSEYTARRPGST